MTDGSCCGPRTHTALRQTRVPSLQEPRLVGNETTTNCNEHAFLLRERAKDMIWENKACSRCRRADTVSRGHPGIGDSPPRQPWDARGEDAPHCPPHPLEGACPPTPQVSLIKKFCWTVGHLLNFMKNSFRELNRGVGVGTCLGSDGNFSATAHV